MPSALERQPVAPSAHPASEEEGRRFMASRCSRRWRCHHLTALAGFRRMRDALLDAEALSDLPPPTPGRSWTPPDQVAAVEAAAAAAAAATDSGNDDGNAAAADAARPRSSAAARLVRAASAVMRRPPIGLPTGAAGADARAETWRDGLFGAGGGSACVDHGQDWNNCVEKWHRQLGRTLE